MRKSQENSLLGLQMPGAKFSARQAQVLNDMPDWLVKSVVTGGYGADGVSKLVKPIASLVSSAKDVGTFASRWPY